MNIEKNNIKNILFAATLFMASLALEGMQLSKKESLAVRSCSKFYISSNSLKSDEKKNSTVSDQILVFKSENQKISPPVQAREVAARIAVLGSCYAALTLISPDILQTLIVVAGTGALTYDTFIKTKEYIHNKF